MTMDNKGPLYLMRLSLGNLALHMEARALVCTMKSNWCRVIDELRKTSGQRDGVTVDLTPPHSGL